MKKLAVTFFFMLIGMSAWAQGSGRAEDLLLDSTIEQYKLDNEIRELSWNDILLEWSKTLSEIEKYINNNDRHDQKNINRSINNIKNLIKNAKSSTKHAQESINTNTLLLEGLDLNSTTEDEPKYIEVTRNQLIHMQTFYKNQLETLDKLTHNAESLNLVLSNLRREGISKFITRRSELPFLPNTIKTSVKVFLIRVKNIGKDVKQGITDHYKSTPSWKFISIIIIVSIIASIIGSYINRRFGRKANEESPSDSRKLTASIAEGIAKGLIPASIIMLLLFLSNRYKFESVENFHRNIDITLFHLLVLIIASCLCIAILSPKLPQWRLTTISADKSTKIGKATIFLIFVILFERLLLDLLKLEPLSTYNFYTDESVMISFMLTIFNFLKAVVLIHIASPSIWIAPNTMELHDAPSALDSFWSLIRLIIILVAITSIVASMMGYVNFGSWLNLSMFISVFLFFISFLVRNAIYDSLVYVIKQKWFRQVFNLRIITLQRIKFWIALIINPLIIGSAFFISLIFWGVPVEKLMVYGKNAFEGIYIGELRISLKGIILSIVVYIVLMRLTTFIQNFIEQNIFTKSDQDIASQHNTITIIKYVGVIISLMAAIAALGIDFQTIALIMGALSVGIGFGLRNVVSNFVSGFLLLLEKPIKVGDWIQVGEHEGFVKDLKFRSTEIETFQQASVIVPNADLITQPVTNMTLTNKLGRIEVNVGIAYSSNPQKIIDILSKVAEDHAEILQDPEPQVMFMSFGENALEFELRCYTNDVINKVAIASELRFEIEKSLKKHSIEIPFPQRVVHMKHTD